MIFLKLYLLAGMVLHKVVWEVLKRRTRPGTPAGVRPPPPGVRMVRAVKLAILLGLVVQTCWPGDVLALRADATPLRIVGAALYSVGLLVAILGRSQLAENWADIEDAQVLRHQKVVRHGLYRFIRHPIYVGDLLLLYGLELALNSWLVLAVVVLTPVVLAKAVREERLLVEGLPGYREYSLQTKRFVPFVV